MTFDFKASFLRVAEELLTKSNPKTKKQYQPSLVTTQNRKTQKGEGKGWLTGIMHLAPSDLSGIGNVCPYASPECRAHCLNTSGMGNMPTHQEARIRRTTLYFKNRTQFLADLRKSIDKIVKEAEKKGLNPAVRINGTSDLPGIARMMAKEYPQVQFYDYTKIPRPWTRTLDNYHITFSRSEINEKEAVSALEHGVNVAVVFNVKKGEPLPEVWKGHPVIDGDMHDLRFLDDLERPDPDQALVIGLRAKGKARGKGSDNGFVVNIAPIATPEEKAKKKSSQEQPHVEYFSDDDMFFLPEYD